MMSVKYFEMNQKLKFINDGETIDIRQSKYSKRMM